MIYTVLYLLFAVSPAAVLLRSGPIKSLLMIISDFWLGFFCYVLQGVILVIIVGRILRTRKKMPHVWTRKYKKICRISGSAIVLAALCICVYGTFHVHNIQKKEYHITVRKKAKNMNGLRIGLVSDMHLGYHRRPGDVKEMVEKLNQSDLDLVCFTGDFYTDDFDAVKSPDRISRILKGIKTTYGTYACYGNHDVNQKTLRDPRLDQMLKDGNVKVLMDESIYINHNFYLIGRLDADETGVQNLKPKTIGEFSKTIDPEKTIISMQHEPVDLSEQARAGIDLSLAGHTHQGQIFPGNLLIRLFWKNAYGKYQTDDFVSIVTSGIGTCGPDMRVATNSEIAVINVSFAK